MNPKSALFWKPSKTQGLLKESGFACLSRRGILSEEDLARRMDAVRARLEDS